MLNRLCGGLDLRLKSIQRFVIGAGPGPLPALQDARLVLKALALRMGRASVEVSSLEAMGATVARLVPPGAILAPMVHAGQRVYCGAYRLERGKLCRLELERPYRDPRALKTRLLKLSHTHHAPLYGFGDGFLSLGLNADPDFSALSPSAMVLAPLTPRGEDLAGLLASQHAPSSNRAQRRAPLDDSRLMMFGSGRRFR